MSGGLSPVTDVCRSEAGDGDRATVGRDATPTRKLLHEGRVFHITARGVAGSMIFEDDFDRRRFVLYLEDVSEY